MTVHDCVVVGGGPAGLSAAIYLARFQRSVLVVDGADGRSSFHQVNENYLGFPKGIPARRLRLLGRQQARRFGVRFATDRLVDAAAEGDLFRFRGQGRRVYRGRTAVLATGVVDHFPEVTGWREAVGRSLFWCITCDGYKVRDRRVAVVGAADEAAGTTLQLRNFTDQLSFVTNRPPGRSGLGDAWRQRLGAVGIDLIEGQIEDARGDEGLLHSLVLVGGREVPVDYVFSQQGARPSSDLAERLGARRDESGYVDVDEEQRTSVARLYAAGDVTRAFSHQVVTAAHEGAQAAQAANYDLYRPEQRSDCPVDVVSTP
jgi:thioredoxin reductase (NADPH)